MSRRNRLIAALVAAPLVAFLLYAAFNWYEFEEVPVRAGMRGEALKDPHLAFGRLLAAMGARARIVKSPSQIAAPPERGVLMLGPRRLAYMTPTRIREIEAWVQRGGLLVAQAEPTGIDDPLLERFGVEREEPGEGGSTRQAKRAPPRPAPPPGPASVDWPGAPRPLKVRQSGFGMNLREDHAPGEALSVRQGTRHVILAFNAGQGRVAFLSDLRFLTNGAIGEHDHAQFAWRLATGAPEARAAVIFINPEPPSLTQWLLDEAWPVLVAAAALLAAWLTRVMTRFGPLAPDAPPVRRSLAEHLRASGRFMLSRGEGAYLLESVRERLWRVALRRRGGLKGLGHSKAREMLASLSSTSAATVQRALQDSDPRAAGFIATAGALQSIEAGLAQRPRATLKPTKGNAP